MFSGGTMREVVRKPVRTVRRRRIAYVKILEQPARRALRFRYECEGRSTGSIRGITSNSGRKTFPTIRIEGYKGRAVMVISCVTKDSPYRPHPHNLVGNEACNKGVCTIQLSAEDMTVTLTNLGIQCVKKKDVEESLRVREQIRVDPYRTGFSHRVRPSNIDLSVVRLCFQVYLESAETGRFTIPLAPVVSEPIYDRKLIRDLVICNLSTCYCPVDGGKAMILLCEKVSRGDIRVRFFEEHNGLVLWEEFVELQPTYIHKQVAIFFTTPQYHVLDVGQPVIVSIQLFRPSDGATSEAHPFEFIPLSIDPTSKRKKRCAGTPSNQTLRDLEEKAAKNKAMQSQHSSHGSNSVKVESAVPGPSSSTAPHGNSTWAGNSSHIFGMNQGTWSSQPSLPVQSHNHQLSSNYTFTPMVYTASAGVTQNNILPTEHHYQHQEQLLIQQQQQCHGFNVPAQFQPVQQHQGLLQQQPTFNGVNVVQNESAFPHLQSINTQNATAVNFEGGFGTSSMLTQDSQQYGIDINSLKQLDSEDLTPFLMLDDNLPPDHACNVSLADDSVCEMETAPAPVASMPDENDCNTTDSLTQLTNKIIQELCSLNAMYNPIKDHNY